MGLLGYVPYVCLRVGGGRGRVGDNVYDDVFLATSIQFASGVLLYLPYAIV